MDVASLSEKSNEGHQQNKGLQPKKILVVEDDKNMTILLGKALLDASGDIEINWASSLEQAVTQLIQNTDIAQKAPYDLIIADIFLEGNGTGLDLFKVINRTYPSIPFLVISSIPYEQVSEALADKKVENMTYLRKPFLFFQCKEKIKNILKDL
jgi:DNA-binding NtrC family response regulator